MSSDAYNGKRELDAETREERRKKRKSRWGGSETDKVIIPGMPTILPPNLTKEQEKIYLRKYDLMLFHLSHLTHDTPLYSSPIAD